jgi:phage protein D
VDTYAPIFIVEIDGKELPEDISQHIEDFSYEDHDEKMDKLCIKIADAAMSFVDHPQLQEGKEIRARWGYLGNISEVRVCTIKEIKYDFSQDGVLRIDIAALDKGHKLTGRSARTCWKDKKVKDIVEDIAKKHGLKPVVDIPGDLTREFVSEGGKNDMVFLKELAQDTGCAMWVQNDELHFSPNKVTGPVMKFRYREDQDGYLQSFSITSKAEDGKGTGGETETAGIDPLSKKEIKETTDSKKTGVTVNLGDSRKENETPHQAKDDETGRVVPTPAPTQAQAKQEGEGKVTTSGMKAVEATAKTIGLPTLKAKDAITIENIGEKFSGNWRVKKVKHHISRSGYSCDLTLVKSDHEGQGDAGSPKGNNAGSSTPAGESKNTAPPHVEVPLK